MRSKYPFAQMQPKRIKSPYWAGHIPFSFELIKALSPITVVELGVYSGTSFAAFCQAASSLNIQAKCYGIDTWEGDIHMGKFDEKIYKDISEYCMVNYPDTAVLIRKTFAEGSSLFNDKTVDLLHMDGTHTYEAVKNDYEMWISKISDKGVILIHDTNITYENSGESFKDYGAKQFFDSVKSLYPHVEFMHSYGLGVLVIGKHTTDSVMRMISDSRSRAFLQYFERLGRRIKCHE
ncbi:MAG: class I SAM-dependent methyltransferase [Candidatus Omnitrophica bacterium]|nr:class I SAM-dependent methyltransferase [Candidatus Omnitrophota bacterium]